MYTYHSVELETYDMFSSGHKNSSLYKYIEKNNILNRAWNFCFGSRFQEENCCF